MQLHSNVSFLQLDAPSRVWRFFSAKTENNIFCDTWNIYAIKIEFGYLLLFLLVVSLFGGRLFLLSLFFCVRIIYDYCCYACLSVFNLPTYLEQRSILSLECTALLRCHLAGLIAFGPIAIDGLPEIDFNIALIWIIEWLYLKKKRIFVKWIFIAYK